MPPSEYARLLSELKGRIRSSQLRAAVSLNREMLSLYWEIGKAIVQRQEREGWGNSIIDRLATDLRRDFPGIAGLSRTNLFNMRRWYLSYRQVGNSPAAAGQLPWQHHVLILNRVQDQTARHWYVRQALEQGWSRRILEHNIGTDLHGRQAVASKTHNFTRTLPRPQSDLAQEILKDPYHFDFLGQGALIHERALESALVDHLREFLLELGVGFAFVGRQYRIEVSRREYFIDLLFYHLRLRSLVALDLKMGEFEPEDAGKMNFYLSALDDQVRHPDDRASIGIILCKSRDRTVVEYSLRDTRKPIGVSAYRVTAALPRELRGSLPTLEQLSRGLERNR